MPLLNAEAACLTGSEFTPAVAVAGPANGNLSAPRIVPLPLTSSVVTGVMVLMPILAVLPEPFSRRPQVSFFRLSSSIFGQTIVRQIAGIFNLHIRAGPRAAYSDK